jgi:hypothetical protein
LQKLRLRDSLTAANAKRSDPQKSAYVSMQRQVDADERYTTNVGRVCVYSADFSM